ncbi:MAG: hypothetical protein V1660_02820 [archaeon]
MVKRYLCITASFLFAILLIGFVSAGEEVVSPSYERPCGTGTDLCTWNKVLPLGSQNIQYCIDQGFDLKYNTFWALNTDTSAQCTFDGTNLEETQLHISIDNDVIKCTLNGNTVFENVVHEGCAPVDPRNGYNLDITPTSGQNTILCEVRDRGDLSHFDACVTGTVNNDVPEFSSIAALTALIGSTIGFIALRRRK